MKYLIIIGLLLTVACSKLDQRLSEPDQNTLIRLAESRSTNIHEISHLGVERIQLSENGSFFVVNDFFTDQSGYFVLVSGELPSVTGDYQEITDNLYIYQLKG